MNRFAEFEDLALMGRLQRLARAEIDLEERIRSRIREAELERRWVSSDPAYQRLAAVLKQVRSELRDTEQEHLTRMSTSAAGVFAAG